MNNAQSRLERTTLFVPASSWPMIEKAAASAADAVCLDLEDSVTPTEKAGSRANVIRALAELDFGRRTRMVRINALDGPYAYRDIIEVVEAAGKHLHVVMIPKVESPGDIDFVDRLLTQVEANCGLSHPIALEAQIEMAAGFMSLADIAGSSRASSHSPSDPATTPLPYRCPHHPLASRGSTMRPTRGIAGIRSCIRLWRRRVPMACAAWTALMPPTGTPPGSSAPAAFPGPWALMESSAFIPGSLPW